MGRLERMKRGSGIKDGDDKSIGIEILMADAFAAKINPTDPLFFVYYESIKREPKIRGIYECRCDERLQTKSKEFTRLTYTGMVLELEHLKTETRLISERFANAMGECEN
jgi:hypothetical protein